MTKKFLIAALIILCTIFITNYSLAMNEIKDATNTVQNVVQNTENGVENVAKDTAGAIKEGTNKVENAGQNMTNDMMGDSDSSTDTSANNGEYDATRTSTGMFGMNNTVWTWIILAVIAAAIIGLVWYYAVQNNNSYEE